MKKHGILNSDIAKVFADLGHTDMIAIADCGLPIPAHVKKIDLAIDYGFPSFKDVTTIIEKEIAVESVTFAKEVMDENKDIYKHISHLYGDITQSYVCHEDFKKMIGSCKAVIRTGENTPYANIILHAGVVFGRSERYEGASQRYSKILW